MAIITGLTIDDPADIETGPEPTTMERTFQRIIKMERRGHRAAAVSELVDLVNILGAEYNIDARACIV